MNEVFADTHFFISVPGAGVSQRQKALFVARPYRLMVAITNVLTEVANLMRQRHDREAFVDLVRTLFGSRDVLIIQSDQDLWQRGRELFSKRLDKEWSLSDCILFVIMRDRGTTDALTRDHHFEQAGFTAHC